MDVASVKESVRFIEVPRPTGISNFLIELTTGEPFGWLSYYQDKDNWAAKISCPETSTLRRENFIHREDAERWIKAVWLASTNEF